MTKTENSILIVSENIAFTECMKEALDCEPWTNFSSQQTSISGMNGQAPDLTSGFEVVVFDTDPDKSEEIEAIEAVTAERGSDTLFVALTGNDVPIQKARLLSDAGVDEVLPLSINPAQLRDILDNAMARRRGAQVISGGTDRGEGHLIAVAQARGGAGSTTTAVNLACSLTGKDQKGSPPKKVVLLDLDLQFGNANVFLDIEDNGGLFGLLEMSEPPDAHLLKTIIQKHSTGVDIICAPEAFAPLDAMNPEYLEETLKLLMREYDYVVVDLPRAVVEWMSPIMSAASMLAIVTDTSVPCIRQTRRFIDFITTEHVGLQIEVVVNREKRRLFKPEHVRDAEKVLETKLKHWLPDDPKLARRAVDLGQPVVEVQRKSELAKSLRSLAGEIAETLKPTNQLQQ